MGEILPLTCTQAAKSTDFINDLLAAQRVHRSPTLLESDRSDEEVSHFVVDRLNGTGVLFADACD